MSAARFDAVLLAAGAGRRLGGCKALLELQGLTALERCLDALAAVGVGVPRVVLGHDAERVLDRHDLSGCLVVVNPEPDRGQTGSLRLGLGAAPLEADAWLLHTVDHPLVTGTQIGALCRAWAARPDGCEIMAPSVDGRRGHPTLYAASLAREFHDLGDDEPAHRVVRREAARVQHVVLDAPWMVRDLDTPDDLEAARAALRDATHP